MLYKKLLTILPLFAALICPLSQGASENEEDAAATSSQYSPLTARLTSVEGDTIQGILTNTPTNALKVSEMNKVLQNLNPHARTIEFRDIINAAQKGSTDPLTPGRATPRLSDAMKADPSLWLDGALAAVGMPRLDTLFVWNTDGVYLPEADLLAALRNGDTLFVAPTYANAQFKNGIQRLQLTQILKPEDRLAGPLQLVFLPGTDKKDQADFDRILSFMPGHPLQLTVGGTPVGTLTRTALPENDAALPALTQRFEQLPDDLRIEPHTTARYGAAQQGAWYTTYLQYAWDWVAYIARLFNLRNYI